ncbi:MAG TPA: endonuclease/exonuclease/phosphatase family protein [Polyangiales bacterium]
MRRRNWLYACLWLLGCNEDDGSPVDDDQESVLDGGQLDSGRLDSGYLDAAVEAPSTDGDGGAHRDAGHTRDGAVDGGKPDAALPLRVLTYNVAGLPEPLSSSQPKHNSPLISPLLNAYDLVVLQEDFAYHAQIVGMADHPFQSPVDARGQSLGDGLNFLSRVPFSELTRVKWEQCNGLLDSGSDCLTPKGFLFARFTIAGATLDVYDLHADADTSPADLRARASNLSQLGRYIREHSEGRAVIVAGDLNARYTREGDNIPELVDGTGLSDVWVELIRGGERPAPSGIVPCPAQAPDDPACEHVDKILYRSGGGLTLRPHDYGVHGQTFVDATGLQLSDHRPVSVVFDVVAR